MVSERHPYVEAALAVLGERLVAVYWIGTGFSEGPSKAPRLLVLVDRVDRALLDSITKVTAEAIRNGTQIRLETEESLRRGADAFPAFTLELRDHRTLLHGSDVLTGLDVDATHLRLHVEQGLRRLQRGLTKGYFERTIDGDNLPKLRRTARRLVFLLEASLIAAGKDVPSPPQPKTILESARSELALGGDDRAWETLARFAERELPMSGDGPLALHTSMLDILVAAVDRVDRMGTAPDA